MTHHTDAARAEFEAWYIKAAKKSVPAFDSWSDIEVRDGCMRPDGESYKIDTARISWEAWQAARRAPAAPVPQGWKLVPVIPTLEMQQAALKHVARQHQTRDVYTAMISAAPQPPEAAPVELPEPEFYADDRGYEVSAEWLASDDATSDYREVYTIPRYTEQQVRELLAAHGIKVVP